MPNRLERLVGIFNEIRKGRYPDVVTLCRMFEIKERTLYDDVRALREEMGMEIVYDRYRNGYFNANPEKTLPMFELTETELCALRLSKTMLAEYSGATVQPYLDSAMEKIEERLSEKKNTNGDANTSEVKFDPVALIPLSWNMFSTLNEACHKRKRMRLVYYAASKGEVSARQVDPYKLLENRGTWYLLAYCQMRQDFRLFALHRIKEYEMLSEHFERRKDFDIDAWLNSAFLLEHGDDTQTVKIHFQPTAARYIRERSWHPTQMLVEHADGSCIMEFRTSSLDETKRWVLTYGSEAEVIEPALLRDLVRRELQAAIKQYT